MFSTICWFFSLIFIHYLSHLSLICFLIFHFALFLNWSKIIFCFSFFYFLLLFFLLFLYFFFFFFIHIHFIQLFPWFFTLISFSIYLLFIFFFFFFFFFFHSVGYFSFYCYSSLNMESSLYMCIQVLLDFCINISSFPQLSILLFAVNCFQPNPTLTFTLTHYQSLEISCHHPEEETIRIGLKRRKKSHKMASYFTQVIKFIIWLFLATLQYLVSSFGLDLQSNTWRFPP